jgi:hypothetical protein
MWRRKILRDIGEPTSGECSTEYLRRAIERDLTIDANPQLAIALFELPRV